MVRKASGTASWHLAPPAQEVTHAIIDVIVDGPIGHQPRAVAEVVRPAAQQTVQPVAYIRPRFLVAGDQQLIDLAFEPLDALPGGARAQVSAPFLAVVLRPKRIPRKSKLSFRASFNVVFASLSISPSRVITSFVHARASAASPRLRMTKSSA